VAHASAEAAARYGLRDQQAFALANKASSLAALGRWDEAATIVEQAREASTSAITGGWALMITAHLDVLRGDFDAAAESVASARTILGDSQTAHQQNSITFHTLAISIAAGRGRFAEARAEAGAALDAGFAPGMHSHAWRLLHAAAAAEGDALGLPAAEPGRDGMLTDLRKAATRLPTLAPVWAAYALLVDAELARAQGHSDPSRWAAAEAAFAALDRPYQLAQIRLRLAEAHVVVGSRDAAAAALASAHAIADRLGAAPLRAETALLAERARLPLGDAAGRTAEPAPATPAEPFGLTTREREVLRRVAAGYTNRRIAEELFISPKTASVHVSNILAKLGVTGRGEAAALAHRLRLFAGA
jgi:DNA-binding CsgD family transcriptional regulator